MKRDVQDPNDDTIYAAVTTALEPVSHMENDANIRKLRSKITACVRRTAEGMHMQNKSLNVLVDEFAENFYPKDLQLPL